MMYVVQELCVGWCVLFTTGSLEWHAQNELVKYEVYGSN